MQRLLESGAHQATMTLPSFLIIGAQKSASSFVQNCIREHPQTFMPRYELPYFEDPYYKIWSITKFEAQFEPASADAVIGLKRPDYLAKPECPKRIHKHVPQAKLIVVLRNPIERAISAYFWYMQTGAIPIRNLNCGMSKILDGSYLKNYPKASEIINYGFYAQQLEGYDKFFAHEQLLVMLHEEFRADPQKTIAKVYRFINVDPSYNPQVITRRPKESIYAKLRLHWLSLATRYIFYKETQYEDESGKHIASYARDSQVARLLYRASLGIDRFVLARIFRNERPILRADLRSALYEQYADSINQLEERLKMDLKTWR